jgi:predicted ArsR family transcriptional regulator
MSGYGNEGTEYLIAGQTLAVNQEFLMATMMATIIVLKEITGKEDIDLIIEQIAEQLYDQFTEAEHGTPEERTDPAGE